MSKDNSNTEPKSRKSNKALALAKGFSFSAEQVATLMEVGSDLGMDDKQMAAILKAAPKGVEKFKKTATKRAAKAALQIAFETLKDNGIEVKGIKIRKGKNELVDELAEAMEIEESSGSTLRMIGYGVAGLAGAAAITYGGVKIYRAVKENQAMKQQLMLGHDSGGIVLHQPR